MLDGILFCSFRKQNRSQKNMNTVYSAFLMRDSLQKNAPKAALRVAIECVHGSHVGGAKQ